QPTNPVRPAPAEPAEQRPDAERAADVRAEIQRHTGDERRRVIAKHLVETVRELLGLRARRVSTSATFAELGLDSLRALELRERIQQLFEVSIPVASIWEHPTIAELSAYLDELL
ncbi:acyl carrier protein, partial [Candidatus Protofrankia californiensis]|uniref:acyl carrier protein n=1 Tax=Candidatus Protofrankia californiensis TaxID=1839754 RepID=UPI0010412289